MSTVSTTCTKRAVKPVARYTPEEQVVDDFTDDNISENDDYEPIEVETEYDRKFINNGPMDFDDDYNEEEEEDADYSDDSDEDYVPDVAVAQVTSTKGPVCPGGMCSLKKK